MEIPKFPAQAEYKWASYVPSRSPKFKVHKRKSDATNAIMLGLYGYPRGGVTYQLNDKNDWDVLEAYEQDFTCIHCGEMGRSERATGGDWMTSAPQYESDGNGAWVRRRHIPSRETRMIHYKKCYEKWKAAHE